MPPSQPLPKSMPAWQHQPSLLSAGPLEAKLTLNQVAPVPQLKDGETLIKVLTAGINPVDYKVGELPVVAKLAFGNGTPGIEWVGRVWATKLPESSGIKGGDLVYGRVEGAGWPNGSLAAFTVSKGEEGIAKVPSGSKEIDWFAGLGVAGLTAYQSIVPTLESSGEGSARGTSVLINGSSGGVGTFTVQIAKAIGCEHIVATCSSANADMVKQLGATEVVDYRSTNIMDAAKSFVGSTLGGRKFDLIIDNAGADMNLYWRSHEYLKEGGKYMFVGAGVNFKTFSDITKIMAWPKFLGGGQRAFEFLQLKSSKRDFERLGKWIQDGTIQVILDNTFGMNEVKEAYKKLKTGRARGKIVVRVSEDGRGDS